MFLSGVEMSAFLQAKANSEMLLFRSSYLNKEKSLANNKLITCATSTHYHLMIYSWSIQNHHKLDHVIPYIYTVSYLGKSTISQAQWMLTALPANGLLLWLSPTGVNLLKLGIAYGGLWFFDSVPTSSSGIYNPWTYHFIVSKLIQLSLSIINRMLTSAFLPSTLYSQNIFLYH